MDYEIKKKNRYLPGLLSFAIPVLIVMIAFSGLGIYPGGKSLLLTYDLRAQLLALYGYLSNGGPGYDNLFHSMSGGLGGGFFGTAALYLSPFDFIYAIIPLKYLPDAIYFMIIIKIGLCGLFFSIFLSKNSKYSLSGLWIVILSCCYALMSYNLMYFMSPMWYDEVMLLPILALCLEKIISGKNSKLFIPIMTFCIISDYYIAYMNVIALIIYFIFRLVEEHFPLKESIKRFCMFAFSGVLSAGISMFVILPVYMDFARGKFSEGSSADGDLIKNTLSDVIKSFASQSYSGLDYNASPNIFCGTVVLILALIWFFFGKKKIRGRIAGLIVLLFYFASFIFGPLDRAWHGFRDPVCFSVRYAYTFVFFMICFAVRGLYSLKESKIKISEANLKLVSGIVVLFTVIELYVNGSYILARIGTESGYSFRDEYNKYCDVIENLVPYDELSDASTYGRLVTSFNYSAYDGALFGYDGLAKFTSSYNLQLHEFFRKIGIGSLYHTLSDKGVTPPSAGLMDAKYFISWINQSDFYDPIKEYKGFTIYKNPYSLPFAYEINHLDDVIQLTDDPYSNMNSVYSEFFGDAEDSTFEIFKPYSYSILDDTVVETVNEENTFDSVLISTDKTGHYFFFVEYKAEEESSDENKTEDNSYNESKPIYRNYYLDGEKAGEYGNNQYSYCVDLGLFYKGEDHVLTLESSNADVGQIWLYYFDEEMYGKIISSVNGFDVLTLNKDEIILSGEVLCDSDILVTLPYEKGYNVYVDGDLTEYKSYRDCIMTIPLNAGQHIITISYIVPGLYIGAVVSMFCILLLAFYLFLNYKLNKNS